MKWGIIAAAVGLLQACAPVSTNTGSNLANSTGASQAPGQVQKTQDQGFPELYLTANYRQTAITRRWQADFKNGWFPKLSPDARYLTCGYSGTWGVDLVSGAEHQIVPANSFNSSWIEPNIFTYQLELSSNGPEARYEVNVSDWIARETSDDPNLVHGNMFGASNGHWASWRGGADFPIVYDDQVVATGAGGALSISDNWVVHAKKAANGTYQGVSVLIDGRPVKDYPNLGYPNEVHETAIQRGYIAYGGYGPIRGIDPGGNDIDLSVVPWHWEAHPVVFFAEGQPWVATTTFSNSLNEGFILIRPWGSKAVIVLDDGDAAGLDVVENNGIITVAMNDPTGRLIVRSLPLSTQRYLLSSTPTQAVSLPAPNHAMDYGYYYADGRYGDFDSTVFPYTNLIIEGPGFYNSDATWGNSNPSLDIAQLFDHSMKEAFQAGKTIYLYPDMNHLDQMLDIASAYWSRVKYFEIVDEDPAMSAESAEAIVDEVKARLQARGLRYPRFVALESPDAEKAPGISCVGIEAYVPQPFNQDDPGNAQRLDSLIENRKNSVASGKCIVMVMMGYDRNGQWTNLQTLEQMQYPAYLESYDDSRVSAITIFDYGRPGGAHDHPELASVHQQIAAAMSLTHGALAPPLAGPPAQQGFPCQSPMPGSGWMCLTNGDWVPPGYPLKPGMVPYAPSSNPPASTPTPTPTLFPTPTAPVPAPAQQFPCMGNPPGAGWVCLTDGDWVPPGYPLKPGMVPYVPATSIPAPTPTATPVPTPTPPAPIPPPVQQFPCRTPQPGPKWVCLTDGDWVPPGFPLQPGMVPYASQ